MKISHSIILVLCYVFIWSCARKGRPSGGPKDESAPIMVIAKPPYKTINFKENTIKLYFDEYIVLKDLSKQLIISPPLKNPPIISPQGIPSKYITIKILDTLKENTTYTFNFGNAIADNNEGNRLENFNYIFSTGKYIDSLSLQGTVADALDQTLKKNISLLLYRLDSTYTDSLIYKEKPSYVTNTLDSLNFKFTNLKEGRYRLLALDETTSDYMFNPKTDKLGFSNDTITLPKDSIIENELVVFKESLPYSFKRAKELFKGKLQFSYEGEPSNMTVELLSRTPKDFKSFEKFEQDKDTLSYWFTPFESDSLKFRVTSAAFVDSVTVKLRKKKIDSLTTALSITNTLPLKDTVFLTTNNPIVAIDKTQFTLLDKDTAKVAINLERINAHKLALLFTKAKNAKYALSILPNAITDIYSVSNDSLSYAFSTKTPEDYGSITINIKKNINSPVILQVLQNNKLVKSIYLTRSEKVEFDLLEPSEYTIRAVIDRNENGKWDTGSFLKNRQPETIIYYPEKIELRANWTFNEEFVIK